MAADERRPLRHAQAALRRHRRGGHERAGARGAALGAEVTGSDRAESTYTARLRAHGIEPAIGHDAANLPEGAEVVVSTAIPERQPRAGRRPRTPGATCCTAASCSGEVSRLKRCDRDSRHARQDHHLRRWPPTRCRDCGRDPATSSGGELRSAGTNAAWGQGDWIVVEADESDRSFLELRRDVAVVTNVELDHHHTYRSLSELEAAFAEFAAPASARIAGPGVALEGALTYGIDAGDLRAEERRAAAAGSRFTVEGVTVELACPAPQRAERPRGPGRLPRGGPADRRGRPGARRLHGRRAGGSRTTARPPGRAGVRRLRPPPDGGPRHARGRAHPGRAAPGRLLPAAPLLPHARAGARVRPRAGAGRRRRGARRLPGARARGGLPRRQRPDGGPGRRRRGAAGGGWSGCRRSTRPRAGSEPSWGRATCC